MANAFYTSYEYQRDLESHMMKNMEWGAVAYLAQSKYGRCDSNNTNCTEVRINNNSSFITGSSAVSAPTCGLVSGNDGKNISCNKYGTDESIVNPYNNPSSVASSTTNNYYGVFDMAGGAWEYVMGVMQVKSDVATPASGADATNNSGFNGPYSNNGDTSKENGKPLPSSKYYDLYDYAQTDQNYNRGKLGDGTKEFGPFYVVRFVDDKSITRSIGSYNADVAYFVNPDHPWFIRGGDFTYGAETGIGAVAPNHGQALDSRSFRIVLTP